MNIARTTFRGKIPSFHSRSGTHKNFTAAAISIKPKTIFIVSNQDPERGNLSKAFGNKESATNGAAKTIP